MLDWFYIILAMVYLPIVLYISYYVEGYKLIPGTGKWK